MQFGGLLNIILCFSIIFCTRSFNVALKGGKLSPTRLRFSSNVFTTFTETNIAKASLILADTSVTEEDIINLTGQTTSLPDPIYAIGIAALIFLGVGVLQFSLGDLTKEVILYLNYQFIYYLQ
jgi:hypothetical protein